MEPIMARETESTHKIALLATGDEIRNGDILNTNSQEIANRLFNNDMQVGMHLVTGDSTLEIETAIRFLLQSHPALIITGGLGPTSDDLTRYALAAAVNKDLIFDDNTWNNIVTRLKSVGYETTPESNRQQALFPEGVTIIPNPNGTAAGCWIKQDEKIIFMLPGPPSECLPMVESNVLPLLKILGFENKLYHKKWLLFGVSEGHIAEELEKVVKPYHCTTGYRIWFPYIEFKIYSDNQEHFNKLVPLIEKTVAPYIINDGQFTASDALKQWLISSKQTLTLCDRATGGALESTIRTPETHSYLHFTSETTRPSSDFHIEIYGLNEYWQGVVSIKTTLEFTVIHNGNKQEFKKEIPLRGARVKMYAAEYICRKIYQMLKSF